MNTIKSLFKRLHADQEGATVIEYALIAALVAVVAIAGFRILGSNVSSKMSAIATSVGST